ncbi:MAG: hypothetical protein KA419_20645 [Acidobacteria bacterium]|nr:hypothetical protein [Acidobacteriota bacterium]
MTPSEKDTPRKDDPKKDAPRKDEPKKDAPKKAKPAVGKAPKAGKGKTGKTAGRKPGKGPTRIFAPGAEETVQDRTTKKEKLAKELSREIRSLRTDFQQAMEKLSLRTEGRMARLAEVFDGSAPHEEGRRVPPAKVSESLLQLLRRFKTKPQKGRLKDILTYCRLVKHVESMLPPEQ